MDCYVLYCLAQGGVQFNVVPAQISVGFDIRITPTVDVVEFESMLRGWCRDAGEGIILEMVYLVSDILPLSLVG